jgi:phenylacetate-CoA ligase
VFTSLSKEALPIIRYRTRDLTRLLAPTARSFRRIAKITGRSDDMLIIRGVNLFPGHIEELILKDPKLSGHYLLEVYREGPLDQMEVMVEVKPEFAHASAEMKTAAERELQHGIKGWLGVTTRVRILDPGHLPRQEGKTKRVIDKRSV